MKGMRVAVTLVCNLAYCIKMVWTEADREDFEDEDEEPALLSCWRTVPRLAGWAGCKVAAANKCVSAMIAIGGNSR